MAKKKAPAKKTDVKKPPTKTEILRTISDETGLTRRDVDAVFDQLHVLIKKNIGRRGPGVFTLPGLVKVKVVTKAATKARKGINPFTGEEIMIKAKPARKAVKVLALKALKDMI